MNKPIVNLEDIEVVADEVDRIVKEGDMDAFRRLMLPDGIVWHNVDDKEKTVEEAIAFIQALGANTTVQPWFTDVRLSPTTTGYVRQHNVCSVNHEGQENRIPVCLIFTLEGRRIRRIDEYLDSARLPKPS